MVRIINDKNVGILANITYFILRQQEKHTHIIEINNPKYSPCIYAMWHANQLLVHGLYDRDRTNILISNSIDGEIVARTAEKWGFKVVRGSSGKKGAVESTMHMLSELKEGNSVAIMVDGPHGPLHKVKNGALKLAQKTEVPIIPAYWYSPQKSFISLPSWDKMKIPFGECNIINIYGTPIYIKQDANDEEFTAAKDEIKRQIMELEKKAPQIYKEAEEKDLWKN